MRVPARVLEAYGLSPSGIESVSGGLINATYSTKGESGIPALALQRLHPVFAAEVNLDIEAVTAHLADKLLVTPLLVRTRDDAAWVEHDGAIWRAITWIEGTCVSRLDSPEQAERAAALVGRFHRAVGDLDYRFQFARSGVHDTAAHLARLEAAQAPSGDPFIEDAQRLRREILQAMASVPPLPVLPERICHGDLKISNVLFDAAGEGLCLIDLDTMGWQSIAFELGDALRSWGNTLGEDTLQPEIDGNIVSAAARGYARGSDGLLAANESDSVVLGLETVCIELAARFCLDVFEDRYFGWDAQRFGSRREHNLLRARGQLALGQSVARQRDSLRALWNAAF